MGVQLVPGKNDLLSWCKENGDFGSMIISQYIGDKPLGSVFRTSKNKIELYCNNCNKSYKKAPCHIIRKQGCPFCNEKSNNKAAIPKDSKRWLVNSYPDLIEEWDTELNEINIEDVLVTSNIRVHWICKKCKHKWSTQLSNRTKNMSGCPECNKGCQGSFMEFMLYTIIKEKYTNAEYQFKINGMSFDIGIPNPSVVIEYQGRYTHNNLYQKNGYDVEARDAEKRSFMQLFSNITYITVNETYGGEKIKIEGNDIYFNANNINKYDVMVDIINSINTILNTNITVREDIETYALSQYEIKEFDESLGNKYTEIINDWDYEKNGKLTPFMIRPKSNKKVNWKCHICGFEWITSPAHRVVDKTGCPKCNVLNGNHGGTHMIVQGINDLKSIRPDIADEYLEDKNDIPLKDVSLQSNREVWWKCKKCGYLYKDKVVYRTIRNHGCPKCSSKTEN